MLKKIIYLSFILALIVVVLGAYTRLNDAGLGCPDWPTCYGKLVVPEEKPTDYERPLEHNKAWLEMIHRYAASILGFLIIIICYLAYKKQRANFALSALLLGLVIAQGLLGMWTVTSLVHPGVVLLHLLGGFATTALLFILLLRQKKHSMPQEIKNKQKNWLYLALTLLTLQIMLGAWTSANYAALSCGADFPRCLGQWWPAAMDFRQALTWGTLGVDYEYGVLDSGARIAIQLLHRIGALLVLITLGGIAITLLTNKTLKRASQVLMLLLVLQVTLGIANVVFSLPIIIATMHNLTALLLMLSLLYLLFKTQSRQPL